MIVYNLYYKGKDAHKFVDEMLNSGIVDKIKTEPGNMRYDYFYPVGSDDTVLLIDAWENQEALDSHHNSPIMNEIMKLREKYDLHMTAERYISDDANSNDEKFIRK